MPKPGRRQRTPSEEIAHFTDREDQKDLFLRRLRSAVEPPVLVFYGIGGSGKTWLLRKLMEEIPAEIPKAFLDFDRFAGGRRFVLDPAAALYEIRQQLGGSAPRFDLAYAVLRIKQGASQELNVATELGAELLGKAPELTAQLLGKAIPLPGVAVVLKRISKSLRNRLRGTAIEKLLAVSAGQKLVLELRARTAQEIGARLIDYLGEDLRELLPSHLNRAVSIVLFFDTFEAIGSEEQNEEHKSQYEQWIQDIASNFDFALTVIGGQNRLTWDEINPEWASHLDQHLVGGLSESDARRFLLDCGVDDRGLQDAVLATAKEKEDGGFHCFSLGLCVDIVALERGRGMQTTPESLRFAPQDWERLAHRFLKALGSDAEARWVGRLALTPRFDEEAAREAFSNEHSAAQDSAWEKLPQYSFVTRLHGNTTWLSVRAQMRWALENQPSAGDRVHRDHAWWREHWGARSTSLVDQAASLAWYHSYRISPNVALGAWKELATDSRSSVPPRMSEHFRLLEWWEPVDLLAGAGGSQADAKSQVSLGFELLEASLGNRNLNLRRAIEFFKAGLLVYNEQNHPQEWAETQNNLGLVWSDIPTGDRSENLRLAIECYEAALRVRTRRKFPQGWAETQNNLGFAWSDIPTGDRGDNLRRAVECYEAALRVRTRQKFPREWAETQNNLGLAWSDISTDGDRSDNLRRAIRCYRAALRVRTEQQLPQYWAESQNNLGVAWSDLPTGSRSKNLRRAVDCYESALCVYKEPDFPNEWAMVQNNLGIAWSEFPTGDRSHNLRRAIECFEAALRVYRETDFPKDWAMAQNNLGVAWSDLPTGNRNENLNHAIECYHAALRVHMELDFPYDWANAQNNLGTAWSDLLTGDRNENLHHAIECYQAALRVFTKHDFPQDWAATQNNLGVVWGDLLVGDRSENLHHAIECYEAALRIHKEAVFPEDWARAQNNLGVAWSDLPTGDRRENLRRAMECFEAALRVYKEHDFPQDWAMTQNNLGQAWNDMPTEDRSYNSHRAIECYQLALRVYKETEFPEDWAMTQSNLGDAFRNSPSGDRSESLRRAIECYKAALRVYSKESTPHEHEATSEDLRVTLEEWNGLRGSHINPTGAKPSADFSS